MNVNQPKPNLLLHDVGLFQLFVHSVELLLSVVCTIITLLIRLISVVITVLYHHQLRPVKKRSIFRAKAAKPATVTPSSSGASSSVVVATTTTAMTKMSREQARYDGQLPTRYYESDNRLPWEFEENAPDGRPPFHRRGNKVVVVTRMASNSKEIRRLARNVKQVSTVKVSLSMIVRTNQMMVTTMAMLVLHFRRKSRMRRRMRMEKMEKEVHWIV